jgi:hypothetical protein
VSLVLRACKGGGGLWSAQADRTLRMDSAETGIIAMTAALHIEMLQMGSSYD